MLQFMGSRIVRHDLTELTQWKCAWKVTVRANLPGAAARGQVSCPGSSLGLLLRLAPLETRLLYSEAEKKASF